MYLVRVDNLITTLARLLMNCANVRKIHQVGLLVGLYICWICNKKYNFIILELSYLICHGHMAVARG